MSSGQSTPMMEQYQELRAANSDCLMFFRMGDFFELFFEDAKVASEVLGIALTHRGKFQGNPVPMAGVPVHAAYEYMQRLAAAGYRIALCDQVEDAAEAKRRGAKAVVKREMVRLVTPGTLTEDVLLNGRASNYLCAVARFARKDAQHETYALAWLDLSIGKPLVSVVAARQLAGELSRIDPAEVLAEEDLAAAPWFRNLLDNLETRAADRNIMVTPRTSASFSRKAAHRSIEAAYGVAGVDGLGLTCEREIAALGALLDYVRMTQVGRQLRLSSPDRQVAQTVLQIDPATRRNLELTVNYAGGAENTLLSHIDVTKSNAGGRLLREWLISPITNAGDINHRLDAVDALVANFDLCGQMREELATTPDIERAVSRLLLGRGSPRDLANIRDAIRSILRVTTKLVEIDQAGKLPAAMAQAERVFEQCAMDCFETLCRGLNDRVPLAVADGGCIREGYDEQLDKDRNLHHDARRLIQDMESRYRKSTGVKSLRIRSNAVLGYFVEASPQQGRALIHGGEVDGIRFALRQTLASAVRLSTEELQALAGDISSVAERIAAREAQLFDNLVETIMPHVEWLRAAAHQLAKIDVWCAMAYIARRDNYVRPKIVTAPKISLQAARHPTVEGALSAGSSASFIPNDCELNAGGKKATDAPRLVLLTGPNMAGKSTYLRQVALITVLAQMGSWVPAQSAEIGLVDQLFSRVGALDDLARGRSTFMVEMVETAAILNRASRNSLVIMDEIGRGTSTFDGLAIAWSCAEYLHNVIGCRALFATHYHEMTSLAGRLHGMRNRHMSATEHEGEIIFLHSVVDGAASRSWGVHVARLAGLPTAVTARADSLLGKLEQAAGGVRLAVEELPLFGGDGQAPLLAASMEPEPPSSAAPLGQSTQADAIGVEGSPANTPPWARQISDYLARIDMDEVSPRQARAMLEELQQMISAEVESSEPANEDNTSSDH